MPEVSLDLDQMRADDDGMAVVDREMFRATKSLMGATFAALKPTAVEVDAELRGKP